MPPCRGGCNFSLDLALLGQALSVGGEDQKMAGAGGQDLSLGRQRGKNKAVVDKTDWDSFVVDLWLRPSPRR